MVEALLVNRLAGRFILRTGSSGSEAGLPQAGCALVCNDFNTETAA